MDTRDYTLDYAELRHALGYDPCALIISIIRDSVKRIFLMSSVPSQVARPYINISFGSAQFGLTGIPLQASKRLGLARASHMEAHAPRRLPDRRRWGIFHRFTDPFRSGIDKI